ncbi:MAG TPA: hypothetical protein VEI83_11890 [Acidimicrobiales bacterium]|nr:hypothetical protein [Acidimicrobiales bacterium]
MDGIWVAPDVIDKAMIVVVHEARCALAVWKGRSRIDVYDLAGAWHRIAQPYAPDEEGMWTRADLLAAARATIDSSGAPTRPGDRPETALYVEVAMLEAAQLIRADASGYALWTADESVDVYGADGAHLCWARIGALDVPTTSQLMVELLSFTARIAA